MNAKQAFDLIAQFVNADENSISKAWTIIRLACNHAWSKGKWWGMTADFFVKVQPDASGRKYVLSPPGYDTLLAINFDGDPRVLRDRYFMFHKNGGGDIKDHSYCSWNTDVYDDGEVATKIPINIYRSGVRVGVRSIGKPGDGEYVVIRGKNTIGSQVISYTSSKIKNCNCLRAVEDETSPAVLTIDGLKINITDKFEFVDNVSFSEIDSITKTITRCPIEIIIIDDDGEGRIVSQMPPWATESKYRKHIVPDGCGTAIHGLFKISKQDIIVSESQPVIVGDEEALISLCKGIDLFYFKEQVDAGNTFLQQGILALEGEMREKQVISQQPIQVVGMYSGEDIPDIMKH